MFRLLQLVRECITLFFYGAEGLGYGELPRDLAGIESGLQFLNLGVLGCSGFL